MKVVAINGSPRKKGNTYNILNTICEKLNEQSIETEIINVGSDVKGCMACGGCAKMRNEKCVIDDEVNVAIQKLKEADGIILGSPVYFAGMSGSMKSFLDRVFYVQGMNGGLLRQKVGASVVAVRRSGGSNTFSQLNYYLNYCEMLVVSGNYWSIAHGTGEGEVLQDLEGIQTMEVVAKNMAYTLRLKESATEEPPIRVKKVMTNFIR